MPRRKGSPNKTTAEIKAMIVNALHKAGGEEYLVEQAGSNPNAFLSLVGKILPSQVKNDVEGKVEMIVRWRE
jgi:hypothetical protein